MPGYGAPPYGSPGVPPPNVPGLMAMAPGAPFGVDPMTGIPYSDKSKIIAGILQLFLGFLGAGRFYTGHITIGVLQLLFGWMTCGIWPLVDAIMMFAGKVTDSDGRPLRDGT